MDFIVTTGNVTNWRVVRHGSLQLNKENVRIRVTDQGSAEEEESSTCALKLRDAVVAAILTAPTGLGSRSSGQSVALLVCSAGFSPLCLPRPLVCLESVRRARYARAYLLFPPVTHEQEQLLQSRPVAGQHSVEQGWKGAGKGWDDSSATVPPLQNPEQVSDDRVANAQHMMQDHFQQTTVISQRRERPEEARCLYQQKCQEAAETETMFNGAIQHTLGKTEALQKHVQIGTMRAESLATTDADFFKTLLDHQEEAQKHLNELSAQLSQQNITIRSTR